MSKYNWNICRHCSSPYLPYRENQVYCSYWCEMLEMEHKIKRGVLTMNDEDYIANQLAAINLTWNEKRVNNIDTNPVECWYAIGEFGTLRRFYKIVPFSKCDEHGMSLGTGEYFIVYESLGADPAGAIPVGVYEDLDKAKARVKFQLFAINNLIARHCS